MKKELFTIPVVAAATIGLLPLNQKIAPLFQLSITENLTINRIAAAQLLTLIMVAMVLFIIRLLQPDGFKKFWRPGNLSAPAAAVWWLGIKKDESWQSVGMGFSLVITATTAAFMWMGVYYKTSVAWMDALPFVLLFSITNSFSEEILCRFSLAAGLDGLFPNRVICWWSAVIFGSVHYFGTPGGLPGVFMAGFLGWFLAKSVLETRGIGWAWFVHFLQDMVIFFALVSI